MWKEDQFCGKGTLYNDSPKQLIGSFNLISIDNLDENWIKYEGDFLNDVIIFIIFKKNKEGVGNLYLTNGELYSGGFSSDLVHGKGLFYKY